MKLEAPRPASVRRWLALWPIAALILLMLFNPAFASEASTGMEWETPLQAFVRSVTGPVAFGISFLGLVICGAVLIWGGEINEFVRRFVMVLLVISVLMFAGSILRRMFAGGAAVITPPAVEEPASQAPAAPAFGALRVGLTP